MRVFTALLFALLASPALAQLHPSARTVAMQAVEDVFRPGFAGFAAETAALGRALGDLCHGPSGAALEAVRARFRSTVVAWSLVELYRLGPLTEANRADRILFWPDRKGIALRQIQQILATQDESAADPASLEGKSVAVQGLGALEFVVFGTGAETLAGTEGEFRCRYAIAIATNLTNTAAAVSAAWNDPAGISRRLIRPASSDPEYRSNAEVQRELLGLLAHGVELIRDQRLLPFLGRAGEAPKPRSALFWRSGVTLASIVADFEGLKRLLVGSEIWRTAATEQFRIGQDAIAAFDRAEAAGASVTASVETAVTDAAQNAALSVLVDASQTLGKLTGEDLPVALGLVVGFSALDGD